MEIHGSTHIYAYQLVNCHFYCGQITFTSNPQNQNYNNNKNRDLKQTARFKTAISTHFTRFRIFLQLFLQHTDHTKVEEKDVTANFLL